ncbi:hypothetical protein [Marinobacter sp. SS21]|uniref:hypothetical protein n=1 Tax=Marinobacter sp. SS21 TaxID=2979460 RepID=UPI00232BF13A|nr:hypothetical protein [Marinobacter sp. SS21]MDC0662393.1 hypothetical protein [Marinobacter sp. SS21]
MENVIKRASLPVAGLMVWIMALTVQAEDGVWLEVTPLAADELAGSSGRQGVPVQIQVNNTEQNAVLAGNVLNGNVVTGNNLISDNAFQNMSGTATVIQNSGNHVVIQDSTQINILFNN